VDLVRGNPTEVKVVLASVATALAIYQIVLASIFYRKLRPSFLEAGPAAWTHRASGDVIAVLLIVVAIMCLSYFGPEDGAFHAVTGFQVIGSVLVALAIVAVTIVAVTAQLGPTSAAELEAQEERQEERLEQQEERREDRND
jgi:uncharacterized membrane protein